MGIRIPALLDAILEATAAEQGAKARIAGLRAALEGEARRRFTTEGAAPAWTAPKLGRVRYDPPGEWTPAVADPVAFASWVAEHHPSEATAALRIPVAHLEAALEALTFADVPHEAPAVEVRPAWVTPWLAGLTVDVDEVPEGDTTVRTFTVADLITGDVVPGLTGTRSAGKLVVNLDRDRRTVALTQAATEAAEIVQGATDNADTEDLDDRRHELEGMPADVLKAYAGRLDLGGSGTKAQLAERIARAEALTGTVELLTASHLTPTAEDHDDHARAIGADYDRELADLETNRAKHDAALIADALEAAGSREALRSLAKARGLSAAGTKTEVAVRLAQDGATPTDLTTRQESTP